MSCKFATVISITLNSDNKSYTILFFQKGRPAKYAKLSDDINNNLDSINFFPIVQTGANVYMFVTETLPSPGTVFDIFNTCGKLLSRLLIPILPATVCPPPPPCPSPPPCPTITTIQYTLPADMKQSTIFIRGSNFINGVTNIFVDVDTLGFENGKVIKPPYPSGVTVTPTLITILATAINPLGFDALFSAAVSNSCTVGLNGAQITIIP